MEIRRLFGKLLGHNSMYLLRSAIIFLICFLTSIANVSATHLIGGYMSYEYLEKVNNEYLYKITLYMFRDVEQSDVDFDDEILLGVYLNNAELDRTMVVPVKLLNRRTVRPPGNEECEYYADNEIEMAFYEKTISLPAYTEGFHITFVRCCRNKQDNLINDNNQAFQGQTYYCFIPNPALRNSSPRFSGVPSPYMCAKDTTTILNRAVDIDGDSLVYRYVWPFQGGEPTQGGAMPDPPTKLRLPITPVQYVNGFNYLQPFGNSGFAKIDENNGLTTLFANNVGSYVVAIEVAEYRNGILLSTVRLDMQILILDCPPNKKPVAKSPSGRYFEVEAGNEICFDVQGTNSDDKPQEVTLFATGDILTGENGVEPPLAKMATRTGTDYVTSEFCWTPSCDQARDKPYIITITARDNGCPPKQDNINIEIKVKAFIGSDEIIGPIRDCTGSGLATNYQAQSPKPTSDFWWEVTGGTILGDSTSSNIDVIWTHSSTGKIRMVEISEFGCPGDTISLDITLVPAPELPVISGPDTVCLNTTNSQYSVKNNSGSTYNWKKPDGTFVINGGSTLMLDWNQKGTFEIAVVEKNMDGCTSDTGKFEINVRKPVPGVNGPRSVCPNSEGLVYKSFGLSGSTYQWTVTGGNQASGGTSAEIEIDWGDEGQGIIEVVETDKFGCVSDIVRFVVNKTYILDGVTPIGDESVCEFDANVPYFVVDASGSIYRWSISGGSQVTGDSTSNIEVTWGSAGSGVVGVREWAWDAVNSKECVSPVKTLDVEINPIPTANEIEGVVEVCQGDEIFTYSLNGLSGSTYEWTVDGSSQNITGQGTTTIEYAWTLPGTFTITVQELSVDSCPGQMVDTFIVVHPKPTSDEIIGDLVHCVPNHENTLYSIVGFPNSTFNWVVQNGTFIGNGNDSIYIDWQTYGFGEIEVLEISEHGCVGDTIELPTYINRLEIDLQVVSVGFPDNRMHGQWKLIYDDLNQDGYQIEKRVAGSEGTWISVKQEDHLSFLETGINTDENAYEYRLFGKDLCGNVRYSEVHTNMLLTGSQDENDFSIELDFTPYLGWDNGVQEYQLYRSINSETKLMFNQIINIGDKIYVGGNSEDFRQCYRVRALEQNGDLKESWSNEICFFFQPNVYVPTAFTPNKDGVNDGFHPVSVAVQTYNLEVYNRWGQKVFTTTNQDESWDGTYQSVDALGGVYMYIVRFTDFQDKSFTKSGTIHLMR